MNIKVLSYSVLLMLNLNLFCAAASSNSEDQSISFKSKTDEESKIFGQEAQKVIDELKDKVIEIIINAPKSHEYLKGVIYALNRNQIRTAWDFLIKCDHDGININKLKVLLQTGEIKINEEGTLACCTPIYSAIRQENYNLFEFLLINGAILDKDDEEVLFSLLRASVESRQEKSITIFRKMLRLYYSRI